MRKYFFSVGITSIAILVALLTVFGCTCAKKGAAGTPEGVVREFVDRSANAKNPEDKKQILALCQGEIRRALERLSDEAFRLAYLTKSQAFKVEKMEIVDVKFESPTSATIVYNLSVHDPEGQPANWDIQRIVELQRESEDPKSPWYIVYINSAGSDKLAFTRGMVF